MDPAILCPVLGPEDARVQGHLYPAVTAALGPVAKARGSQEWEERRPEKQRGTRAQRSTAQPPGRMRQCHSQSQRRK